ncbi:hypothetical protein BTO13_05470 [Polaribacter gangjinensis]|uniref:Uncharacterized protein n=1 Tax=Polaribacter gangjinensis TaxID=574710 RepID=A0A2S7WAS8_9FLAO|nr:hypothetical protein BTO13_05470 [Polaribacter gangjinensis]
MDKDTMKQVFMLVVTSVLLYFCGSYLTTIGELKSLFDGLVVMIFFFSLFPFLSLFTIFVIRFLKSLLSFRNY